MAFIFPGGIRTAATVAAVALTMQARAIARELNYTITIRRSNCTMQVLSPTGATVVSCPVSLGRGGIKQKHSMADYVTPTGTFTVDLILDEEKPQFNAIAKESLEALKHHRWQKLISSNTKLRVLFATMNNLDFNGDGHADHAYGIAYIGLNGLNSGPKLSSFQSKPYWYSIALHGTAHGERQLGSYSSGGCIHVSEEILRKLIETHLVTINTPVTIVD